MCNFTDRLHLLIDQYRDASNLNTRIALHERFSTNPYGWMRWVFDHLALQAGERVLELGCGPASLWVKNSDRLPVGCQLTLTDLSPGMIAEAQRQLAPKLPAALLHCEVVDAQNIPYEAESFDVVIANHMLYHVPDRAQALAEARRVLRPGGRFFAATVGEEHLREISELARKYLLDTTFAAAGEAPRRFGLENATTLLADYFTDIRLNLYEDRLIITEVEPLVMYVMSGMNAAQITKNRASLAQLAEEIDQEIESRGVFRVTKATGMFEARKERRSLSKEPQK